MNYSDVSPKFMMDLINRLEPAIWNMFDLSYVDVERYIRRWHVSSGGGWEGDYEENFSVVRRGGNIDLTETLHSMPNEIVFKIAAESGIAIPGFIPAVPIFQNALDCTNENAARTFQRAAAEVYENPDHSIALASSTLEGVMKSTILLLPPEISADLSQGKSLTAQTRSVVRALGFESGMNCPPELVTAAGQIRGLAQSIDDLRSRRSSAHGTDPTEHVVDNPLWAAFVVNATATLGLFLLEYCNARFRGKDRGPIPDPTPIYGDIPF